MQLHHIAAIPKTVLITLTGAIDATTVWKFQSKIDELKDDTTRFILDMENIKYVNSTGLSLLVNLAEALEKEGGGVALLRIQPKAKALFDMLGLSSFFSIFSDVNEAIEHFRKRLGVTAPATARTPTRQPETIPTAPVERVAAPSVDTLVMEVPQEHVRAELRATLQCAICNVSLFVPDPGNYRCPRCQAVFTYLREGKANFLPRRKLSPIRFTLTATDECTEGFGLFVAVLARKIGFTEDDVSKIVESLRETCTTIIHRAYKGDNQCSYHALVVIADGELNIKLTDHGKILNLRARDPNGKPLFELTQKVMDKFEIRPHPKGGNILTLMKKCKK